MPTQRSFDLFPISRDTRSPNQILRDIRALLRMHKNGGLGGTVMPEDVHPRLPLDGKELSHYFTLGMALNYQRNSYALWRSATAAFDDPGTRVIFEPEKVIALSRDELSQLLTKHKVGLQPVKHTHIWHVLCCTISKNYAGDIRNLFADCQGDIGAILNVVQRVHKKNFPYLSGPKIGNYWLHVMSSYTSLNLTNRAALNVAPDTHLIQASRQLGLITSAESENPKASLVVAERWKQLLVKTDIVPIDVHTPLWLWSRSGFKTIEF